MSKLINSTEISDDIIGVMRNVVAQYPPKGSPELETSIEIPLSVRLWRVSGCHELLASLGFDLMEVGQDQVTLRTGKQANRRNCQFVLQALLALFDTQEAPKSLGIDSSSSSESLNDDVRSEIPQNSSSPTPGTSSSQNRSISPVGTVKSLNLNAPMQRIPLMSSGSSAFISYVRKRGEPDGGRTDVEPTISSIINSNNSNNNNNNTDSSLTTDSEFSDGYVSQTLNRFEIKPKLGYTSLRGPVKVGRPGGGNESDAAFTPSPPITIQNSDINVTMALAHQTRIRNLYSTNNTLNDISETQMHCSQRPDSSSSASSTTDWEGSGHATVLRRAHQSQMLPPMPTPRQTLPLVDNLGPLAPLYNNMNSNTAGTSLVRTSGFESSDSEFERILEPRDRIMHKPPFASRKIPNEISVIDRLSVRTEVSNNLPDTSTLRKPLTISDDDDAVLSFKFNANNLYFSPHDGEVTQAIDQQQKDISSNDANSKEQKIGISTHSKNIQDSIMRQINREMTPTISEVYHERNLGLDIAPSLSKLLLSKNYEETDSIETTATGTTTEAITRDPNDSIEENRCNVCNGPSEIICNCKSNTINSKKVIPKPWLNVISSNPNDINSSSILDCQTKLSTIVDIDSTDTPEPTSNLNSNGTYPDLSKRDEGDGRSVADSQCSGNYKVVDISTNAKVGQIQQYINKFNMNSNSS